MIDHRLIFKVLKRKLALPSLIITPVLVISMSLLYGGMDQKRIDAVVKEGMVKDNRLKGLTVYTATKDKLICLEHKIQCQLREDKTFPCISPFGDKLIGNLLVENTKTCK